MLLIYVLTALVISVFYRNATVNKIALHVVRGTTVYFILMLVVGIVRIMILIVQVMQMHTLCKRHCPLAIAYRPRRVRQTTLRYVVYALNILIVNLVMCWPKIASSGI